jgi:soluble lytic murein transglycosylase-like protein
VSFLRFAFLTLALILLFFLNPLVARLMTAGTAVVQHVHVGRFYRLISAESSFRVWVRSDQNAIGLGQVQPGTARYVYVRHRDSLLWFPPYNLQISALYLKYLLKRYDNNWSLALAAYNWGETNVDQRLRRSRIHYDAHTDCRVLFSDIPETSKYLTRILGPQITPSPDIAPIPSRPAAPTPRRFSPHPRKAQPR